MDYFPGWEWKHHPNWRTLIFFRGVQTTNQNHIMQIVIKWMLHKGLYTYMHIHIYIYRNSLIYISLVCKLRWCLHSCNGVHSMVQNTIFQIVRRTKNNEAPSIDAEDVEKSPYTMFGGGPWQNFPTGQWSYSLVMTFAVCYWRHSHKNSEFPITVMAWWFYSSLRGCLPEDISWFLSVAFSMSMVTKNDPVFNGILTVFKMGFRFFVLSVCKFSMSTLNCWIYNVHGQL